MFLGPDPNNDDTDGDGLADVEEVFLYGTDPVDPDTFDDDEVVAGTDPLDPSSV